MCVASCFGNSLSTKYAQKLEMDLGLDLSGPLDEAAAKGFMDKQDDQYRFIHDLVQKAAYSKMKEEDRCMYHFKYGLSLYSYSVNEDDDVSFFAAIDQINRGGPCAVEDSSQFPTLAQLNLQGTFCFFVFFSLFLSVTIFSQNNLLAFLYDPSGE